MIFFAPNEKARKDSFHFVLALGDNFYSDGVISVNDLQRQMKLEKLNMLIPGPRAPFQNDLTKLSAKLADSTKNRKYAVLIGIIILSFQKIMGAGLQYPPMQISSQP